MPVHSLALTIEPVPEWGSQTIPQIYNELFFIMWDNLFFKITKWGDYFFSQKGEKNTGQIIENSPPVIV